MPGKRLTDDQRVEIAEARFRPLAGGHRMLSYKVLEKRFTRPRNTIARAIEEAFSRGLVELVKVERSARVLAAPILDLEYRNRLIERFPALRDAVVVAAAEESGDRVHRALGYALAPELRRLIPNGAIIGLGSGRGPYYTVERLRGLRSLPAEGVTLMSLTGSLHPRTSDIDVNVVLDADHITGLMGPCFRHVTASRAATYAIADDRHRDETLLSEAAFDRHCPTLAIVGVGVLREGHRFYDAVMKKDPGPGLGPIFRLLERLVHISKPRDGLQSCPVGDICNRLFWIESAEHEGPFVAHKREILELINGINEKLLTVTEAQMAKIGGVCLVAGTPGKAPAIRHLLQQGEKGRLTIQVICTDLPTAKLLLD